MTSIICALDFIHMNALNLDAEYLCVKSGTYQTPWVLDRTIIRFLFVQSIALTCLNV